MTDLQQLNNPIAESYWRALLVRELENEKASLQLLSNNDSLIFDRAITVVKGHR